MKTPQIALEYLNSLATLAFYAISIVIMVRGWSVIHFFVDRVRLVKELDQSKERIKDRDQSISDLTQVVSTGRLAQDAWRAEVARLNEKLDTLSAQIDLLEAHLDTVLRKYDIAIAQIVAPLTPIPEAIAQDVALAERVRRGLI